MNVHLVSAYPFDPATNFGPLWLKSHADEETLRRCTDDPEQARCILFVENHPGSDPYFLAVRKHPLFRRYQRKCVLYHDADRSVTAMLTLSPSIERWQYDLRTKRTAHYIARLCENDMINRTTPSYPRNRKYLYSFIGSSGSHVIRSRLLEQPRNGRVYLKDTAGSHAWQMAAITKAAYEEEYLGVCQESSFVLCPRGIGPCSYRLFEAMQLGRTPVVIADQWFPIPGIDWNSCAIFVSEGEIDTLDCLLSEREEQAVELGIAARAVWERHFSPQASLKSLIDAALTMVAERYDAFDKIRDMSQFLNPWHMRNLARHIKNRITA